MALLKQRSDPFLESWGILLAGLLPVVTAWIRAGRGMEERWFMPALALLIVLGACYVRIAGKERGWFGVFRDPVFWLGLAFLSLLGVQYYNAGRELVFVEAEWRWIYGPPPRPAWPSSFSREEASQMLCWYFPAWVLLLLVRHWRWTERALAGLLSVLFFNAALLSVFGIIQYATGTRYQYWFHFLSRHFFSTFGYPNHAASFFLMNMGVGAGLFFRYFNERVSVLYRVLLGVGWLLCLLGALLSLSRFGILMAVIFTLFILGYFLFRTAAAMPPARRINVTMGLLAVVIIVGTLIYLTLGSRIGKELKSACRELSMTRLVDPPEKSLTGIRYPLWVTAWHITQDYPWFGAGGWGYAYLRQIYLPVEKQKATVGFANVHNDPLNILVEFGMVGYSLLMGIVLICGHYIWRKRARRNPLVKFSIFGLCILVLHSIIDLPFRCPADLFYWLAILASISSWSMQSIRRTTHEGNEHYEFSEESTR